MYLKSLELSGFKSFAKKSTLEFNAPISSIVGPNGSGKSNIAEAFRFVLGEQSIKSLRGKRGEDLIFNGGGEAGRGNRASVKIVFDNSKRFLNLDFDEVTIERAVFRDGINEYLINGSQVRLRDVMELLAGAHIGSSGHHIISQGEADKILNANPRERKAMIEDALGLKIYQYKREESERKLVKTGENIKSVESLRREIMPHIKFLKKQVEKVEKALEMKESLKGLYKEYLKREHEYIKAHKEEIKIEKLPLTTTLARLEKELQDAKDILARSGVHDKKSDHVISLEEKIRHARNEKDRVSRELGRIEGEIASEQRILKKQQELISAELDKTVALKDVEMLQASIEIEIKNIEKEEDPSALRKVISSIRDMFQAFVKNNKSGSNDVLVKESKAVIEKLASDKSTLEKELSSLVHEENNLQKEYIKLQQDIEKEKDSNRDAEKKVFEVMSAQNEIIGKLNTLKVREEKVRLLEEDFKRELGEAGALVGRDILDYSAQGAAPAGGQGPASGWEQEDRDIQQGRRRDIEKIKIRLEDSGIGSSGEILKEYKEASERDLFLVKELEDLEKSAASLKTLISELQEKLNTEFKVGIEKINKQFSDFFALMFGGGHAALAVTREIKRRRSDTDIAALIEGGVEGMGEELDETETASALRNAEATAVEEGIDINVNLPRKKIKGLVMLSGGERALTSIALLFAMSQVNPPPFIILDETDAALDEANSKKYGDMIENLAKLSQLILITHNRETMSRAGILYGVTMMGGISKLLSIKFEEAVAVAK